MTRATLGLILLLVAGCANDGGIRAAADGGARAYRFLHHETTGQMDYVLVDGREIPVEFSDDSNPRALALLKGLKPEIFVPNTSGQNASGGIYVVGSYEEGYSLSARLSQLLGGEGYHLFTLRRWYVSGPVLKDASGPDMTYELARLERLRKSDFEGVTPTEPELEALMRPGG